MYKTVIKRFFDLFGSISLFIFLLPFFIIIYILLYFSNKGKPLYIQRRPGKNNKIFKIVKFKTMTDEVDENGELLPDLQRITKLGAFVRNNSLDEIPQILNVIKGDMSFVGPRPLREEYLEYYNDEQLKRHNVIPGITGWAQINGRNTITWEKKFEYDLYYVKNISFLLDFKILLKTIKKVVIKDGINSDADDTMPFFTGTK